MEEKVNTEDERSRYTGRTTETPERRGTSKGTALIAERLTGLDLSNQGLRTLNSSLFLLSGIKELLLSNNDLDVIPPDIQNLRCLERLNLSHNKIRGIPPELGKMVWLRELYLNDNLISTIPMELGSLHALEVINLVNNPLIAPFSTLSRDKSLIHFCRENNTAYPPPADRAWVDTVLRHETGRPYVSAGTYNILCNFYAAKCTYAPSWVLNPDLRKETILQNIVSYNVDILCLQEVETYSYFDFYREQLEVRLDYGSVFIPKGRAASLADKRTVDGCATFWRRSKFRLVEQISVDFFQKITTDIRFSLNQNIIARHTRKDNVALILVLESTDSGPLLVINAHLYWDPEYADVKLLQTILLLEEVSKAREKYPGIPILFAGDFNSLRDSYVYKLIIEKSVDGDEFNFYDRSPFSAGFSHSIEFKDAYAGQDLPFTNFTPTFCETIDYIFFSNQLVLTGVLSAVESEYRDKTAGLPNIHFPSDHIFIGARFMFNNKK